MRYEEFTIEGRNAVIEAFRSGKPIDKVFILDGCRDETYGDHPQGSKEKGCHDQVCDERNVLTRCPRPASIRASSPMRRLIEYAEVSDILEKAKEKGEDPFIFILDNIEIRTISVRSSEQPI